jgi:hypothetical protein
MSAVIACERHAEAGTRASALEPEACEVCDLDLWLATICLLGRCYGPDEALSIFADEWQRPWWMDEAADLIGWS